MKIGVLLPGAVEDVVDENGDVGDIYLAILVAVGGRLVDD